MVWEGMGVWCRWRYGHGPEEHGGGIAVWAGAEGMVRVWSRREGMVRLEVWSVA